MARDLAVARLFGRLVAKRQRTERQNIGEPSANAVRRIGIVIAGDPDPIAAALEGFQRGAIAARHAQWAMVVVEVVAQGDHETRRVALNEAREPRQSRRCVVGRQQHAALGKG